MHPTLNYRHSRRSACDKCRGQKLRCERGHMNGMSCERCLKAQQPCITSMNHPAPVFLPIHHAQGLVQRDSDDRIFGYNHDAISMIPKPSTSKGTSVVLPSSTNAGLSNSLQSNFLDDQLPLQYLPGDTPFPSPEDLGLGMPLDIRVYPTSFEPWGQQPHWLNGNYNLPLLESALPELTHQYSDESLYSPVLGTDISMEATNESINTSELSLLNQLPSYSETAQFFGAEGIPESFWSNLDSLPSPVGFRPGVPCQEKPTSVPSRRKELLKLNAELLDDLDMLEEDHVALSSESLLNDLFNPSVTHLKLPVYRLLHHSSHLLEIIQSFDISPESCNNTPAKSITDSLPRGQEGSTSMFHDVSNNSDEYATTISLHDSGYGTAMKYFPDRSITTSGPKCDIAVLLSVLEAHCYLTRIYRTICLRLYQLFLSVPPVDAKVYLLLPKLQLGHFHMDGNLAVQVQVLLDLGSRAMGQIDELLGFSSGYIQKHEQTESYSPGAIGKGNWSTAIRDLVLAQEQDACEMTLVDLMQRLRQLVRDPVFL
ncbi:uncharacterized protein N7511_008824 [Penicillium nucicola]|uniref:uncharacterized protein n=1 Tax=Penicillium nucicola TaxID=1850975 RepID=UPI0025452EC5|nr:uncharacterized protein N7511_008824 [Penicillium nucicola]KAJ5747128.1 hypothetical protein N7511_008824 [Penicillium nucicola]